MTVLDSITASGSRQNSKPAFEMNQCCIGRSKRSRRDYIVPRSVEAPTQHLTLTDTHSTVICTICGLLLWTPSYLQNSNARSLKYLKRQILKAPCVFCGSHNAFAYGEPMFLMCMSGLRLAYFGFSRRIEPMCYESVLIQPRGLHDSQPQQFLHTIEARPLFFSQTIKRIFLHSVSSTDAARILQICTGVVELACRVIYRTPGSNYNPIIHFDSSSMRPKRLSLNISHLVESGVPDFKHAFFSGVTHLDIRDYWTSWMGLAHFEDLPRLTHIFLSLTVDQPYNIIPLLRHVLASCPSLERLVGRGQSGRGPFNDIGDPRMIVAQSPLKYESLCNPSLDWIAYTRGDHDDWQF